MISPSVNKTVSYALTDAPRFPPRLLTRLERAPANPAQDAAPDWSPHSAPNSDWLKGRGTQPISSGLDTNSSLERALPLMSVKCSSQCRLRGGRIKD